MKAESRNKSQKFYESAYLHGNHRHSVGRATCDRNQKTLDLLSELLKEEIETFFHFREYCALCTDANIKNLTEKKSDEELIRADKIASRISALGGTIQHRTLELNGTEPENSEVFPNQLFSDKVILKALLTEEERLMEHYKSALAQTSKHDVATRELLESQLKIQKEQEKETLNQVLSYH